MTICPTRSWSESAASVLSTQWRSSEVRGRLGESGSAGDTDITEAAGDMAGANAPHPDAPIETATPMVIVRGFILEYMSLVSA